MYEPRRVLLTHYDLDGVSCDLFMSKMYAFDRKFKCGYAKMSKYVLEGKLSGFDSAVITDISLNYEQYMKMSDEYKDKFLFIDHHAPTIDMVNEIGADSKATCVLNKYYSATAIIYQVFMKHLKDIPGVMKYVTAVDAYDCWRHKKFPEEFKNGYNLNTLFWRYKYNDFFSRFLSDMTLNWTPEEQQWIDEHNRDRDEAIKKSDKTEFGESSILSLDTPKNYLNDFGLYYDEYNIFYILYTSVENQLLLSVRTTREDIDIGKTLKDTQRNNPYIYSAGGHPQAGGVDFIENTDLDTILDVVEEINDRLEGKYVDDVPY